jgi:hypothetical protein
LKRIDLENHEEAEMRKTIVFGIGLVVGAAVQAQEQPNMQDVLQQLMQGANQQGGAAAVEVADFRKMKELMPEKLGDLKRESMSGEKSGALGMVVSFVEAVFVDEEGGKATVKVTDMGSMAGFAAMAQAGWAMAEIDRDLPGGGFERTKEIRGHKGIEKFSETTKTAEVRILASSRLIFELKSRHMPFATVEGVVKDLPIEDFIDLISGGAKDAEDRKEEG